MLRESAMSIVDERDRKKFFFHETLFRRILVGSLRTILPAVMDVWKWRAAEAILDAPADEALFVTIPDDLEPALSYALHARPERSVRAFDGARCLVTPTQVDTPVRYLAILGYEHRSLPRSRRWYRQCISRPGLLSFLPQAL